MEHKRRIEALYAACKAILENRGRSDPEHLPSNVDRQRLEEAYEHLKEYEFVLKRKVLH